MTKSQTVGVASPSLSVAGGTARTMSPSDTRRFASPWGTADSAEELVPGIVHVSTPSHGGYWISPARFAEMPKAIQATPTFAGCPQWYEEDCDWALVALAFPRLFSPRQLKAAIATVQQVSYHALVREWLKSSEAQVVHSLIQQYVNECGHLYEVQGYSYGKQLTVTFSRVDGRKTAVVRNLSPEDMAKSQPIDLGIFGDRVEYMDVLEEGTPS